jgi:protein-S-isoprenylcysteine O-methyltransferase Ste14
MLWLRGFIFTVLVPATIAIYLPHSLAGGRPLAPGFWRAGWLLIALGAALYFWCLARFLLAGGTPAIFFTRPIRFLLGQEPGRVVRGGPYRWSRNPMYLAVVTTILGQALLYRSTAIFTYGVITWLVFHGVVVLLEEPHLAATRGPDYRKYLETVPRWFGRPRL